MSKKLFPMSSEPMHSYIVGYDLDSEVEGVHNVVSNYLDSLEAVKLVDSTWLLKFRGTASNLVNSLKIELMNKKKLYDTNRDEWNHRIFAIELKNFPLDDENNEDFSKRSIDCMFHKIEDVDVRKILKASYRRTLG